MLQSNASDLERCSELIKIIREKELQKVVLEKEIKEIVDKVNKIDVNSLSSKKLKLTDDLNPLANKLKELLNDK